MNQRTVFKVVEVVNRKMFSSSSLFLHNEFLLTYEIGKTTYPKIGRIFVFDTYEHASSFVNWKVNYSILKGIATDVGKPKFMARSVVNKYFVELFWTLKQNKKSLRSELTCSTIEGTLNCSSFTPTARVW